ncbi:glycosyl hydrolase [Mycena capillaripes]|nr:glycosyl hydrolase [Mycena capillaripes]
MKCLSALVGVVSVLPALTHAYNNPVLWEDLADLDIRRVNNTYYYSASSMHFSPGAPILSSQDLVNWQYIGHSVPTLDFGSKYDLTNGQRAYINGIWASFFDYHPKKNLWFWGGCVDFADSYIYTAPSVTGPWTRLATFNKCYYDCGLLIDDDSDSTMYVSYGFNSTIWVAQLNSDAIAEVQSQMVFNPPTSVGYLEGTRMYKRNGIYYILATHPANQEWVLQSTSPWGPYTANILANNLDQPIPAAGYSHQGGIVDTPGGEWYYMAFQDSYPLGRSPVLAPITWGSDNFPTLQLVDGQFGASYSDPVSPTVPTTPTGLDTFTSIGPQWEWNHNPDTTKFSISNGLELSTATVTFDLYAARNTITRRILGPTSTATIELNYGSMIDGDRSGLVVLRDQSAWVGVERNSGAYTVAMVNGLNMNPDWSTNSTGTIVASASVSGGTIWLRATAYDSPAGNQTAVFFYSADGTNFMSLGNTLTLENSWEFFMGYRFGIFNYATVQLGGTVTVSSFDLGAGTTGSGQSALS